jgi:hypothetical protein
MRRTSQLVGLDFSTGRSISPLPVIASVAKARLIFMTFRERVRCAPLASLGNWTAIENKDASRLWCSFRTTTNPRKSLSLFNTCLNAAEMRQSFESKEFDFSIAHFSLNNRQYGHWSRLLGSRTPPNGFTISDSPEYGATSGSIATVERDQNPAIFLDCLPFLIECSLDEYGASQTV